MALPASTLLDAIETGIVACASSQDYSIRGRRTARALLDSLMKARRELKEEINTEADGSGMASLGQMVPLI